MRCLNNKGYMLIEIILASALAMGMAYFLMDITIKLKNKNDELLVKTLVSTDQAIIYNTVMEEIYNETFSCSNISISGKKFTYTYSDGSQFTNIVSDYVTTFKKESCTDNDSLVITLDVKQLPDEEFDVVIDAK